MTQAANLGALGTNVSSSGIAQAAGGGTAGTAGVTGFKNRIINGDMQIWQRGTSFTNPSVGGGNFYTADRWGVNRAGDLSGATVSQSTDVPSGFQYSLKLQRTAGNTSTAGLYLFNSNESVNTLDLAGQSVTISFWVKAGANYSGGALSVIGLYGTGTDQRVYAYTGASAFINATQAITSTWTRYSFTATVASNATEVGFQFFWTPTGTAGADDSIYITGIQLEAGSTATNFDVLSIGTELMLCQRYYSTSFPYGTAPVQNSGLYTWKITLITSGYGMYSQLQYPVPMRITATTITGYNGGAANNLVRNIPAGIDITNLGINPTSTTGFNIVCYGGGGDAGLPPVGWNWAASAEL
jgi:hypothetical protein